MPERDRGGAVRRKARAAVAMALFAFAGPGWAAETWLHPVLAQSVVKAAPPARRGARPARPAVAPTPTSDRVCVGESTVTPPPSQCCKRYRVSAPLLDGQPSECSGDVYYADESQPSYGFHWNDFGAGGVTSASLRLNPGVSCDVSGTRTPVASSSARSSATAAAGYGMVAT